jgi:tRNA nucleotidyltransferase/poly(A) polymerase
MSKFNKSIVDHINFHLSEDKEKYEKFFRSALDKFSISSPADLDNEKKKEFFNYIDKNYKAIEEVASPMSSTLDHTIADIDSMLSVANSEEGPHVFEKLKQSKRILTAMSKLARKVQ